MNALTMREAQIAYDNQSPPEDDGQPESERIAEVLGLPHYHWLPDAIADAIEWDDARGLLNQCRKHLAQRETA